MARLPHSTEYTLVRDGQEIDLEISYSVEPYDPGCGPSYASGGEPPSGGGVEDMTVTTRHGAPFTLSDAEASRIADWIAENHDHDDGAYYEYEERDCAYEYAG
jgi:hypothetical protein